MAQNHYLVEFNQEVRNNVLTEGQGKKYVIEGIFIQCDVVNGNRRVYLGEKVRPGIVEYVETMVKRNRAVGELNHPNPSTPEIDYKNVSHKIESLTESGSNWIGKAVVTKGTPSGAIVAGLMDEGVVMGISSRATGSTRRRTDGITEVIGNYRLSTAGDIVSDPSAPDAFLTNLMEGKEWAWANGALVPLEEDIRGKVNAAAKTVRGLTPDSMRALFEHITSLVKTGAQK